MIFRFSEEQKQQLKQLEYEITEQYFRYHILQVGNPPIVSNGKEYKTREEYEAYLDKDVPVQVAKITAQFSKQIEKYENEHLQSLKTPAEVLEDAEKTAKDGLYAAFINDCKGLETEFNLTKIDPHGDGITADGKNEKENKKPQADKEKQRGLHLIIEFKLRPFDWNYAADIDALKAQETTIPKEGPLFNALINPPIYEDREGARRWITEKVINKHLSYLKKKDYPKYKKALQSVRNLLKNTSFVQDLPESAKYWQQIDASKKQTKKIEKATNTKIKEDEPDKYLPTFQGRGTNDLLQVDTKRIEKRTRQDEIADRAILPTESGQYKLIVSNFSKLKSVSINVHKLLSMAVSELAKQNNYSKAGKADGAKLRVNIPLNEYMHRVYPSTVIDHNAANDEAEERRAENAIKYARKSIKADLKFLYDNGAAWTEKVKNQKYTTDGEMHYISGYQIKNGEIQIEFPQSMAEYLLKLPENQYATWLLRIDSHKPNAYRLGLKLVEHSNMDNNIIKGTANRLQVSTLLKIVKLPTFESLQNENEDNSRKWADRIKEPLESCLDELQAAGGLSDWQYVRPGGIPLTDNEAESITDYHTWENLLIEFQLKNAPDHTERLKRRAAEKKKAAAKKAAKKKKKEGE